MTITLPSKGCSEIRPWPHELRVANILALAGHAVEFLPKTNMKTADILLDDVAYEIKSPKDEMIRGFARSMEAEGANYDRVLKKMQEEQKSLRKKAKKS